MVFDQDSLKLISFAAGTGTDNFSMSRGSFTYRKKISSKKKFSLDEIRETEGASELVFKASGQSTSFIFTVTRNGDFTRISARQEGDGDFNRFWIGLPCSADEHFYGAGETYSEFDLAGQCVRVFVAEHQNANRISKKIIREKIFGKKPGKKLPFGKYESYYAQPTLVSSDRYFIHVDTSPYMEFDLTRKGTMGLYLEELPDITVCRKKSFEELSYAQSSLLGRQHSLPDWIHDGAIVAIQGGTEIIDRKLAAAEKAGLSVCGVWSQDWCGCRRTGFGYQVMWNWEWDRELYKDLDKKIPEWKAKGVHFLGYINPFIALEKDLYKTASEKGYCVKDKEGKDYLVTITTFPAAMIDFTNPEAYEWYKNIIKENMIELGLSGWMADFGEYLPLDSVLWSKEDPALLHNRWPAIWAKMNREAVLETGKENEVFFFMRAGHTGTIPNCDVMWTGDQHVDWSLDDGLASVIPATLSLAMSGFGITHSDAGGYTTIMQMTRSKELLMRWEEMCAFSPLLRSHEGNQPTRNVQFDADDELLKHLARMTDVHIALKNYLKLCIADDIARGTPVMRPLFYHYDEEPAYTEMYEYLLGRDILVAPVIEEGALRRTVYLPDDEWVHLFTGDEFGGGTHTVESPIGYPPVFIRKASTYVNDLISKISRI
ncbi:MAG: alpha-glucosidase [Oscillospiraceae bacterium]|nr:alpha-glucosidase [Oscillospiraceae bacterium]